MVHNQRMSGKKCLNIWQEANRLIHLLKTDLT